MPDPRSLSLISFLRGVAALRQRRATRYDEDDKVVYLGGLPADEKHVRSPFVTPPTDPQDAPPWLVVQKARMPPPPALPPSLQAWIPEAAIVDPAHEPRLPEEAASVAAGGAGQVVTRRLEEHPEVRADWEAYLTDVWRPWAAGKKHWDRLQAVYADVDEMRRTLEDGGERYELLLAFGLLQWETDDESIARHVFVAPAEITLHAARGRLTVEPAGSFERFRLETDMLPPAEAPVLDLAKELTALDIAAWSREAVAPLLRNAANAWRAEAQADASALLPRPEAGQVPSIVFAPALVLRRRRSSAYTDMLGQLVGGLEAELASTAPWAALVDEGAAGPAARHAPPGEPPPIAGDYRFPLPANDEQREILDRLRQNAGVLVKGPPGTGKSHTIANLICHLLSEGHRVLVTAQAPKPLTVLRGLLPKEMQNLCVTSMGGSRADQKLLEDGINSILARQATWPAEDVVARRVADFDGSIREMRRQQEVAERRLREIRQAETEPVKLRGGYAGTRGAIARQVAAAAERFDWFPHAQVTVDECPLDAVAIETLARAAEAFPAELLPQLAEHVGGLALPVPREFAELCRAVDDAPEMTGDQQKLRAAFANRSDDTVTDLVRGLAAIQTHASRAAGTIGDLADAVVGDLAVGRGDTWRQLARRSAELLSDHRGLIDAVDGLHVTLPELSPSNMAGLADAVEKRRAHFASGGRRGWWLFTAAAVRDTAVVERTCRVNGRPVRSGPDLEALSNFMRLRSIADRLEQLWPGGVARDGTVAQVVLRWHDRVDAVTTLVDGVRGILAEWQRAGWPGSLAAFATPQGRAAWRQRGQAELGRRRAERLRTTLHELGVALDRELAKPAPHACLAALRAAVTNRDPTAYAAAFERREQLITQREAWAAYERACRRLDEACPGLGGLFRSHLHDADWQRRAGELAAAWQWAVARRDVSEASGADPVRDLSIEVQRLEERIEQATSDLVAVQAWNHFFRRLDPTVRANLVAWQSTMRRIGQGTGRHANLHRREARGYLAACIPAIPVWVMPLHKLWDTVRAQPALFDTIIIDEASQAGIDALPVLMLGRRIIVVGDDMQNSPEAVGVNADDVQRLIEQHLGEFRFASTFALTSSLFDHAYRTFPSQTTLREHFRCVPEIIRFSNRFYDPPLIPLRQVPAAHARLPALRTVFVQGGAAEGSNAAIRNDAEAEEIVNTVRWMVDQEAYENKTIGVIAMQGRAQAERIFRRLATVLSPQVIEERRIRCGESANFQGDQRDVMLLSLVVGPNQPFVARTTLADQRRYNVAMSRARDQVWLFHSVRADELAPHDLRHQLLTFFEQPHLHEDPLLDVEALRRVAGGPREMGTAPGPFGSWFELDVCLALMDRGFYVQPQVEVAHYRIDLVVEGATARLAVECDGDYWHGPERYAADMARQRQLERAGWTFSRVREAAFYADREAALAAVIEACAELGIGPWSAAAAAEADAGGTPGENAARGTDATAEEPGPDAAAADEAAGEDAVDEEDDVPAVRSEDIPFSGYGPASDYPDPRDALPANVRECLRQIIGQDGPLMYSSVFRLYAQGCPALRRCGRGVKAKLNVAIGALIKAGVVVREAELPGLGDDSRVLRLADAPPWRIRPAGERDILEIPPRELMAVLDEERLGGEATGSRSERDWASLLLRRYGGRNMTSVRQTYLFAVVQAWLQAAPAAS